jgi:transcriptional regulator with XRE-family HTH domain
VIDHPNSYENLTTEEKIGILIFICRESKNISRKQLASKTGKTVEVVSAIENLFQHREGKRQSITYGEIEMIAQALEVPISHILPK